ncbi:hypothetical protein J6590_024768 [Homalodisca vitripennis]|nr:hypothetical protein J6590_024768 [Homalodisca vitripennis]
MDHSWFLDDGVLDSSNSESETELESRLYSIVHHNDLSQPLPPELAQHYSIHPDSNGEVVVALNDSLEDIKLEGSKNVCSQLDNIQSFDTSTTSSAVGNSDLLVTGVKKTQTIQNINKRFRAVFEQMIQETRLGCTSGQPPRVNTLVLDAPTVMNVATWHGLVDYVGSVTLLLVDIDQAYSNFLYSITIALDRACPEKTSRKKRMIPYDEETNELKEKFIEANNLYLANSSSEDKAKVNSLKKAYNLSFGYLGARKMLIT